MYKRIYLRGSETQPPEIQAQHHGKTKIMKLFKKYLILKAFEEAIHSSGLDLLGPDLHKVRNVKLYQR